MDAASWAALLAALGIGAVLREIVVALIKGVSGRVGRERDAVEYERKRIREVQEASDRRTKDMQAEIERLDKKADDEIVKRRQAESRAARYERLLILNGIFPSRDAWTSETSTIEAGKEEE